MYDPVFKYGQNFYLVLTEEAKERILNVSDQYNLNTGLHVCSSFVADPKTYDRCSWCCSVVAFIYCGRQEKPAILISRPWLFNLMLNSAIHQIKIYPVDSAIGFLIFICWIVIHPVGSTIQCLSNWGQHVCSQHSFGLPLRMHGMHRTQFDHACLDHPRGPRGSQSCRVKRRDKSFQAWAEELLGTDSHRTISNGQENAGSWLGTKNALYYCSQLANSFSWVLFVSLYTTANISPHSCLVRSPSFPNQKGRNYQWVDKRFRCYQQEQFNLHWENSVSDGSQCIVNNRKFKIKRRRESKKSNSLTRQNNNTYFACASRFFVYFFAVTARPHENA